MKHIKIFDSPAVVTTDKLFESPDNLYWYDSAYYYTDINVYPFPFSIVFKNDYKQNNNKKAWNDEDYLGVIIGPMGGGHGDDVFDYDNPMYQDLKNEVSYSNAINCRVWLKGKIISYWHDTKRKVFYKALKEIESILTDKIKDGTFNTFMGAKFPGKYDWLEELTKIGVIKNNKFKIFNNRFKVELGNDLKMVALSKFIGGAKPKVIVSKEEVEKATKDHTWSPMKKMENPSQRMPGWKPKMPYYKKDDETEIEAKDKHTRYSYTESIITKFKLYESPDNITLVNDENRLIPVTNAFQDDGRAFGFYDGDFKTGRFHNELLPNEAKMRGSRFSGDAGNRREEMFSTRPMDPETARGMLDMSGRLWMKQKYISFWDYPASKTQFRKVVKALENRYNLKIWNNSNWKVEILVKNDKFYDPKNLDWDIKSEELDVLPMMIPIKSYDPNSNGVQYKSPGKKEIDSYEKMLDQKQKNWDKFKADVDKFKGNVGKGLKNNKDDDKDVFDRLIDDLK